MLHKRHMLLPSHWQSDTIFELSFKIASISFLKASLLRQKHPLRASISHMLEIRFQSLTLGRTYVNHHGNVAIEFMSEIHINSKRKVFMRTRES